VGEAMIARTGIQSYSAGELGLKDRSPSDMIRVYRPPEAVFDQQAMAGMAHRPVTNDHPSENVTADNWKRLAVGFAGGDVARDGKYIRVPLALMDAQAIRDWDAGKRELSVGYECDLNFTDGVTPEGEPYDAVQDNIRPNHIALCRSARGGPELRLDGDPHVRGDKTVATKTITFDGLPVEATDAAEAVINKLKGMLDTSGKALETALADHKTAIAAKDAELGKKDAEIADLKGKVLDAKALDALVAERGTLLAKVKAIAPTLDAAGKTNAELKRAAVAAKLGDDKVKDRSDDYVGALFDHLSADAKDGVSDPVRDALKDGLQDGASDRDKAHAGYVKSMTDAWKGEADKAA
jgi:hypothetical protein